MESQQNKSIISDTQNESISGEPITQTSNPLSQSEPIKTDTNTQSESIKSETNLQQNESIKTVSNLHQNTLKLLPKSIVQIAESNPQDNLQPLSKSETIKTVATKEAEEPPKRNTAPSKINQWLHKDRRCPACIRGDCGETDVSKCEDPKHCKCKCGVGSTSDTLKKVGTIAGGIGLLAGGTALAVVAGPIALPLLFVGGLIGSAGASAAVHGISKTVTKEQIKKEDLSFDIGVGAVAGLLTAGIATGVGAGVAAATSGLTTSAATTVGIGAGTGALSGVSTHAVKETASAAVGDKEWEDWGKSKSGTVEDTLKDWGLPLATGILGGALGITTDTIAKTASSLAANTASQQAVTGAVKVGGAVVKEGAQFGVKKALSDDPEDYTLADWAFAAGTSVALSAVGQASKVVSTKIPTPSTTHTTKITPTSASSITTKQCPTPDTTTTKIIEVDTTKNTITITPSNPQSKTTETKK